MDPITFCKSHMLMTDAELLELPAIISQTEEIGISATDNGNGYGLDFYTPSGQVFSMGRCVNDSMALLLAYLFHSEYGIRWSE